MEIIIRTPRWFDSIYLTGKYAINSIKWMLDPIRCSECNTIVPTKYLEVRHETGRSSDDRWGASNSNRKVLCQHCVAKKVREGNASLGITGYMLGSLILQTTVIVARKTYLPKSSLVMKKVLLMCVYLIVHGIVLIFVKTAAPISLSMVK
jgi:methyl coenzyme M reductase alpha subunit